MKGVTLDEGKIIPVYAGKIWKRSVEQISDDSGAGMFRCIFVRRKDFLCNWHGAADLCVFQDVVQEYLQAQE